MAKLRKVTYKERVNTGLKFEWQEFTGYFHRWHYHYYQGNNFGLRALVETPEGKMKIIDPSDNDVAFTFTYPSTSEIDTYFSEKKMVL